MSSPSDGLVTLIGTQLAMARSAELAGLFQQPSGSVQRRYEICRAYFLERQTAQVIADRLGLHVGTVQAVVRDFAAAPDLSQFFAVTRPGRRTSPKREAVRERAAELRREHKTLGEIGRQLREEGHEISESYLATLLREEGFSPLPRGGPRPRPGERARDGSEVPKVADVRELSLEEGRIIPTQAAGLFLFVPLLLEADFTQAVTTARYPGTEQIPAVQALLSLLAPKLLGKRRVSHISDLATDEGAGLFAGMNVLPKTTYATDYSYRTERVMNERFVDALVRHFPFADSPHSFNLDFHAIPFRGEKSHLQNHWVPKRHRAQPAVMAFVAQEAAQLLMCYATANVLRQEADEMVVRFVDHWKEVMGSYPARVLFDSRATTYPQLNELNRRGVGFITIRRRGAAMLRRVRQLPAGRWHRCYITQSKGKRRPVRYLEETVTLDGYEGQVRQLIFNGLGHESPTFLLTNDLPEPLTGRNVIETYAQRNHVEHSLGEKITFFHLDCLSSEVRLNVDFDLTLTVAAAMLYQRLGSRLKGFAEATPDTLHRRFVNTHGRIEVHRGQVIVYLAKRTHNPLLKEAGFEKATDPIPWLSGRSVRLECP
jgi:transposase